MDAEKILNYIDNLLKDVNDYTWNMYFMYKKNKKNEYSATIVNNENLTDDVLTLLNSTKLIITKNGVLPYAVSNTKNIVDYLLSTDSKVADSINNLVKSFSCPNADLDVEQNRYNGYCVVGYKDRKANIIFIIKQNPLKIVKNKVFTLKKNKLTSIHSKIYSLSSVSDCVIFDNDVFMLSEHAEEYLAIDSYIKKIFDNNKDTIRQIKCIRNIEGLITKFDQKKYHKILHDLSNINLIDTLNRLTSSDLQKELNIYDLEVDSENYVVFKSDKDYDNFAKLICCNYLTRDDKLFELKGKTHVKNLNDAQPILS